MRHASTSVRIPWLWYTQASGGPMSRAHALIAFALCVACLVSSRAQETDTQLVLAVKREDVEAVRALLKQRANVHATENDGFSALHWAAQRNNSQLVNLLLDAGADPRATSRYRVSPLYLAALNGSASIIERLLDAGVDPNSTAHEGQTMLMTAALAGKADAVRLLVTRGARRVPPPRYGEKPVASIACGRYPCEPGRYAHSDPRLEPDVPAVELGADRLRRRTPAAERHDHGSGSITGVRQRPWIWGN